MKLTSYRLALILCCILSSCSAGGSVYVSDRHAGAYDPILKSWDGVEPYTLILLDYHHDIGPGPDLQGDRVDRDSVTSFNWLGGLVAAGVVDSIYWVSGRDLLKPNRNARRDWLERKLSGDPLSIAAKKREAIKIIDWSDLIERHRNGWDRPMALSLDLDILTVDPGKDPDRFLEEILAFIEDLNPDSLTIAFSAAYQPDPPDGWRWLSHSLEAIGQKHPIVLESGLENPIPESVEELNRWCSWEDQRKHTDFGAYFAPGRDLWNWAPRRFWATLAEVEAIPGDRGMERYLSTLKRGGAEHGELSKQFPTKTLEELSRTAVSALLSELEKDDPRGSEPLYRPGGEPRGIAVRFASGWEDRGCLSFYSGVDDPVAACTLAAVSAAFFDPRYEPVRADELEELEVEVTVFGEFIDIDDPMDFIPGLDSLLLDAEGERTLLQASLASERNLSRIQFLSTLTRKAGLGPNDWKEVRLLRAPTVSLRRPLIVPDGGR